MPTSTSETDPEKVAALDAAKGPCGVCQGKYSEHGEGKTRHAWVPEGSTEMLTHEEAAKKTRQGPGEAMVVRMPTNGQGPLQRLIEVLSSRGALSNEELMYITGITGEVKGHGDDAGATHGG